MKYKMDENGQLVRIPAIQVETAWGVEERYETDNVFLFHPERCEHGQIAHEGADRSVGYMSAYTYCEDCNADLSDNPDFNGETDEWDDGDRAYDSWKDDRDWDRD